MKYRFNYQQTKHLEDFLDYMEEHGIDENNISEEERNTMLKDIFGVITIDGFKYFDRI